MFLAGGQIRNQLLSRDKCFQGTRDGDYLRRIVDSPGCRESRRAIRA